MVSLNRSKLSVALKLRFQLLHAVGQKSLSQPGATAVSGKVIRQHYCRAVYDFRQPALDVAKLLLRCIHDRGVAASNLNLHDFGFARLRTDAEGKQVDRYAAFRSSLNPNPALFILNCYMSALLTYGPALCDALDDLLEPSSSCRSNASASFSFI